MHGLRYKETDAYGSFLNNDQAAADSANFMKNVKFDGVEEDLTAPGTPWIYYGVRNHKMGTTSY